MTDPAKQTAEPPLQEPESPTQPPAQGDKDIAATTVPTEGETGSLASAVLAALGEGETGSLASALPTEPEKEVAAPPGQTEEPPAVRQEEALPATDESEAVTGPQAESPTEGSAAVSVPELEEPFRSFYAYYGPTLCGRPLGEVVVEEGRRRQYFACLAVEEYEAGRLRLVPLGEAWLALRAHRRAPGGRDPLPVVDLRRNLRRDPSQHYSTRPLCDIRYLVIHHTGAPATVGPHQIASAHVEENRWPGIGYHYVVDLNGTVYHTQDLTVVSYHARQFNPASVGIALMGDLTAAQPTPPQLEATARLIAGLLFDLGLPLDAVRGHREMVPTPCPGDAFLRVWRPRLMAAIQEQIDAQLAERVRQVADHETAQA